MKIFAAIKVFSLAAEELGRFCKKITDKEAEITRALPHSDDTVFLCPTNHPLADPRVRENSDEFAIVSHKENGRTLLVITAGRPRAAFYGVYAFLEEAAGCHYFWDGDVIPKAPSIPLENFDLYEKPRFEYRAIRYFAHRSLHRFQAEHWSFEDWKREIDWMLKRRLNLFMLRIGTDDLFQRAFPDIVPYPSNEEPLPEQMKGYDDRTTFWSLQFRGQLRKQILDYAFRHDLLHPEDCGTMTHWYSRTPLAFLEKVKPALMQQKSAGYSEQTGLAWDITDEKNLKNYQHLTQTHIKEFGKPEIFHTIGLAERSMNGDREEGFFIKKHAYDTVTDFVRKNYPKAPILVAAWDFYFTYYAEEVRKMIHTFDPQTHIILDYTVDLKKTQNDFEQWDVVGKFPYIFGIFHGYQPQSHIHGDYAYLDQKLKVADEDSFCKGMAYWPELSHSDTLMLEYFTDNAWRPDYLSLEEKVARFCKKRYGIHAKAMQEVWTAFIPLYELTKDQRYDMSSFFHLFENNRIAKRLWKRDDPKHTDAVVKARNKVAEGKAAFSDMEKALSKLASLPKELLENEFIARDSLDLLRTIAERKLDVEVLSALLAWVDGNPAEFCQKEKPCLCGMELFARILAVSEEFSIYHTHENLKTVTNVNPCFEETLKNNLINNYCRSSACEAARFVYLPEMKLLFEKLSKAMPDTIPDFTEEKKQVFSEFLSTPLSEMKPKKEDFSEVCKDALSQFFCNEGNGQIK
ncbi:MAG: hypothetical protein E7580_01320 [Ruminococcaceae bacterium]|nr:hypothetical protein [Oscillospiraceae bacterium]